MKVKYLGSAAAASAIKDFGKAEIALAGRSNVGKSSLLNALAGTNVARTSKTPGRTRMVNYFDFENFVLVDLPGYGFAKASKTEQEGWQGMIEGYLSASKNLKHVFVLVDSNLKKQTSDEQMIKYLFFYNIPFTIIATKVDKIAKSKRFFAVKSLAADFKVGQENVIGVSAEQKIGLDGLNKRIEQILENKDEIV